MTDFNYDHSNFDIRELKKMHGSRFLNHLRMIGNHSES